MPTPHPVSAPPENASPSPTLTPQQRRVIDRLAAGASLSQAADAEQIHRNTVSNWRRTLPAFSLEVELAALEYRRHSQEQLCSLVPFAIANLRDIMMSDATSPSLKLRASLAILKMAAQPIPDVPTPARVVHPEIVQDSAQSCTTEPAEPGPSPLPAAPETVVQPGSVHNPAQSCTKPQPIRVAPQPGRNSPCPCSSGLKFKRCCANGVRPPNSSAKPPAAPEFSNSIAARK